MVVGKLEIEWVYSTIGCTEKQRATVRGLGLRRLHGRTTIIDTPATRGMIAKVAHLVSIVETGRGKSATKTKAVKKKVVTNSA